MLLLSLTLGVTPILDQTSPYQVGEQVELNANGSHWQKCVVIDPGDTYRVLRLQCEPYEGPGYSRHGGIFTETITSTSVRKVHPAAAPASTRGQAPAGRPPARAPRQPATTPVSGGGYTVGQQVELEASGHWVPCTVSDIQNYTDAPLIRVQCQAYPALTRPAGTYIVHNNETGIRPATGRTGPAPRPVRPAAPRPPVAGGTLPLGEYACYGSGGRIMAGLGFKLLGGGRYTDLDGATSGRYAINGSTISFTGGHLDGQTGRDIQGKWFRIGAQATCELWS